jgi:hypothetical protein
VEAVGDGVTEHRPGDAARAIGHVGDGHAKGTVVITLTPESMDAVAPATTMALGVAT